MSRGGLNLSDRAMDGWMERYMDAAACGASHGRQPAMEGEIEKECAFE